MLKKTLITRFPTDVTMKENKQIVHKSINKPKITMSFENNTLLVVLGDGLE